MNDTIDLPVKEITKTIPIIGSNNNIVEYVDKKIENVVEIIIDNVVDNYIPDKK